MSKHRPLRAGEIDILLKATADAERLLRGIDQGALQRARSAAQQAIEQVAPQLERAEEDTETVKRDIPHEPGCWMRFRPLTKTELDEARAIVQRQADYDLLDGFYVPLHPSLDGYDKGYLTRLGIVAWGGPLYSEPYSSELADELDVLTREWAARQVLDVSVPRKGRPRSRANGKLARAHAMRAHEGYANDNDAVAREVYPELYNAGGESEARTLARDAASKGRRACPKCRKNS